MDSVHLPVWVEYVKALGTPIVALIAASIAGGIAYRQWTTARNKLKLDLFEKRMEVYQNAVQLIIESAYPHPVEWERVTELSKSFASARWILNEAIAEHLLLLEKMGAETILKPKLVFEGLTDDQKMDLIYRVNKEATTIRLKEMNKLDAMFNPYLKLEH